MNMITKVCLLGAIAVAALSTEGQAQAQDICYRGHVQGIGNVPLICDGAMLGTVGQSRRLEAVAIPNPMSGGGVCYQAYLQDLGWQGVRCNNQIAGTTAFGKRMEALFVWHNNPPAGHVLQYRAHIGGLGWLGPVASGVMVGSIGQSRRIEALEVNIVRPGENFVFWQ